MTRDSRDQRRHPRYPAELRVRIRLESGDVDTFTSMVSHGGFSVRLPSPLALGAEVTFLAHLPDGKTVIGDAVVRNALGDGMTGLEISLGGDAAPMWSSFIEEEGSTGSLWRMIGRYTSGTGESASARAVVVTEGVDGLHHVSKEFLDVIDDTKSYALRFHTVGENGEGWRVCFEKCPSVDGIDSDLAEKIPGFRKLAERAVARILVDDVVIRVADHAPLQTARVAELTRGGYAFVQGGEGVPVGLVSLGVGEMVLIEIDGETVFPNFTALELERIACDTFRTDLTRPLFPSSTGAKKQAPAPVAFSEPPPLTGQDAIMRAQDTAARKETRVYGDRTIDLYPAVWARAVDKDGNTVMGPSMRDGQRALVLVLVGPGAPRVLRVDTARAVSLMAAGR